MMVLNLWMPGYKTVTEATANYISTGNKAKIRLFRRIAEKQL